MPTGSVYSAETYIPSYEELTVPELELTSGVFRAASLYLGKYCDNASKEFMLCKGESNLNPARCLNEGKEVTRCGFEFFRAVKKSCYEEFTEYWKCVDKSPDMRFDFCRGAQAVFDKCAEEKLNITRPEPGYFSKIRVHDSSRPRPQQKPLEFPERLEPYKPIEGETKLRPKKYGFLS